MLKLASQIAIIFGCSLVLLVTKLYVHAALEPYRADVGLWALSPFIKRAWLSAVIIGAIAGYPVIARKPYFAGLVAVGLLAYQIAGMYVGSDALAKVGLSPAAAIARVWPEFLFLPGIVGIAYLCINLPKGSGKGNEQQLQYKTRAFTLVEVLVVISIIAVLAAVIFPVFASARRRAFQVTDTSNMRQLYMAISMYEEANGDSPPTLLDTRTYVTSNELYRSPVDLVTRPDPVLHNYSAKPFAPDRSMRSAFRISYAYHKTYPPNDEDDLRWHDLRARSEVGILASPWSGSVGHDHARAGTYLPDGPSMDGPILRINMDGSFFKLAQNRDIGFTGSLRDFFFNR